MDNNVGLVLAVVGFGVGLLGLGLALTYSERAADDVRSWELTTSPEPGYRCYRTGFSQGVSIVCLPEAPVPATAPSCAK